MTDPERLMVSGSGFERAVLGAGAVEKPSAALVAQMEQGLGLGGAATATATATLSGKLIAAIAASLAVGGIALWSFSGDPPSPPSTTESPGLAAQDDAQQAPPSDEVTPPEADSIAEPKSASNRGATDGDVASGPGDRDESANRTQTTRTQVRSSRPAEMVPPSTVSGTSDRLKEEVRLLDSVRGALESGQKARALSLLDQYQDRFPEGVLRPEARKLRQNANAL